MANARSCVTPRGIIGSGDGTFHGPSPERGYFIDRELLIRRGDNSTSTVISQWVWRPASCCASTAVPRRQVVYGAGLGKTTGRTARPGIVKDTSIKPAYIRQNKRQRRSLFPLWFKRAIKYIIIKTRKGQLNR